MTDESELAAEARAWPFEEARKLVARLGGKPPDKGYVLLQTGYGPSGLPHIGTFGEVVRTTMVQHALRRLSDVPTRLFTFSDDMDGLRKVPDNIPNRDVLQAHLGKPLTEIPDPFGTHESFAHHNNARLREFLDEFGFTYEFKSATECYRTGVFDQALLRVLQRYDEVMAIMLPTLGAERRATYSPFLPICPRTRQVLQASVVERKPDAGTIVYRDPDTDDLVEVPVTGGHCKLQWKPDWGMRWFALGVDYEMSGKDLIDSVKQSGKICRVLGGRPPEGFTYELFLDQNGEKISKSKGNGLSVEEWLTYGTPAGLSLFMYQKPKTAKRLYFDIIPRTEDDYLAHLRACESQDAGQRLANPAWHIHAGAPPPERSHLTFSLLLNLANACHSEDKDVLWGFITRYDATATAQSNPLLDRLVGHALAFYRDFVKPTKKYRSASEIERAALQDLSNELQVVPADADSETFQNRVYEVGKRHPFENLREWFRALYEILLGQSQGPRFGSFVALYGRDETVALIGRALAGEDLS